MVQHDSKRRLRLKSPTEPRTDSKISHERHHRFSRCSMFSRGTATPLPVDEGRDKLQLPPKADPGGVSLRPPETRVAKADATAVRAVSPGTYKRPAGVWAGSRYGRGFTAVDGHPNWFL